LNQKLTAYSSNKSDSSREFFTGVAVGMRKLMWHVVRENMVVPITASGLQG